jgi:hypothetical protein
MLTFHRVFTAGAGAALITFEGIEIMGEAENCIDLL